MYRKPVIQLCNYLDRQPPYSSEAETAVLGSMLLDSACIPDIAAVLPDPEAFYTEAHQSIHRELLTLGDKPGMADVLLVAQRLVDTGKLESVGGTDYLRVLADGVPTSANALHYARIVSEKHRLRKMLAAVTQTLHDIYTSTESPDTIGAATEQRLVDAQRGGGFSSEPVRMDELCCRQYKELADREGNPQPMGVLSGFAAIDEIVGAMMPGWVIVLAARPSVGKSALGLSIALRAAHAHQGVGFFSLEMTGESLAQRYMGGQSGISPHRWRSGQIDKHEYKSLLDATNSTRDIPLWVDFSPGMALQTLKAKARRLIQVHSVRLIIVDYLQLIRLADSRGKSKYEVVTEISRDMKVLAGELGVPIILLSQLNRGSENRENKRPRMSDLRDTGAIEEDADAVLLIHREDFCHKGDEGWLRDQINADKIGTAEIIVEKNRHGPCGVVKLKFVAEEAKFDDMEAPKW